MKMKLVEIISIIDNVIDDTAKVCHFQDCIDCNLKKIGLCKGNQALFLANRVVNHLANMNIIEQDKISYFIDLFMHYNINYFKIEVYKHYER